MQNAEKLDLEAVRTYLACKGTPTHGQGCGCRNGVELLREAFAAVERVLAIGRRTEFMGSKTDTLMARGWNGMRFRVREALGVRDA